MPRHLLQESVDRLTTIAEPPAAMAGGSAGGVHTDTLLILAAVLCFLLCVVGLALVARCSRLCNPSAFSLDAPGATAAKAPCKGVKKKALQSLPTVSWAAPERRGDGEAPPECAICLAEFERKVEHHGRQTRCVHVDRSIALVEEGIKRKCVWSSGAVGQSIMAAAPSSCSLPSRRGRQLRWRRGRARTRDIFAPDNLM